MSNKKSIVNNPVFRKSVNNVKPPETRKDDNNAKPPEIQNDVNNIKPPISILRKSVNIVNNVKTPLIRKESNRIYPEVRKDSITDNYFGTKIPDPYRWLENVHSEEVRDFVTAQNQLTDRYLKSIGVDKQGTLTTAAITADAAADNCQIRERIRSRLLDLWGYCDYGCPFKRGDRYFYFKDGALYMLQSIDKSTNADDNVVGDDGDQQQGNTDDDDVLILDPNSAADGFVNGASSSSSKTHFGLSLSSKVKTDENFGDGLVAISNDGNVLAYGLSENGSAWSVIHFKDLSTGKKYGKDVLKNVRQDTWLAWTKEGNGLFYARYPEKMVNYKNVKIFYHQLGRPQTQDKLILEFRGNPNWELKPKVSDCGNYLLVYVLQDCGGHTSMYLCKMTEIMEHLKSITRNKKLPEFLSLTGDISWDYDYITNLGSTFYFLTNNKAPNWKIVKVNVANSKQLAKHNWPVVVTQKKIVLNWAICVKEKYLVTCYMSNVNSVLQLRILHSGLLVHQFPLDEGTVAGHCGRSIDSEFFFKFSSFLVPGTVYRVNLERFEAHLHKTYDELYVQPRKSCCFCLKTRPQQKVEVPVEVFRKSLPLGFTPEHYLVKQLTFTSKDGVKASMFLVHKSNLVKNGENPCLLVGYGGFNASLQPSFDPTYLLFVANFDGIYAVVNVRGGGEFGQTWYEDGIGLKKQNSLNDFQFAARYLIRSKYTCPEKLAIRGNSNGGFLVAACVNQTPHLFGAAVVGFGVLDLLRFHKFSSGSCWISDFGSSENKKDFQNLLKISPLHNVKRPEKGTTQYPAMLLVTSENDEIVLPLHSYKMIAQLQSVLGGPPKQKNPFLLRVEKKSGHGEGGMTFETAMDEIVDILLFIKSSLNLKFVEESQQD